MISVFRKDGLSLVRAAEWGSGSWRRARGLIGAAALSADHGLVLAPCRAVHTCFMRFALDIIFFSREGRVVRMAGRVKPFRFVWGGRPAWGVIEMQSGWFPWAHLQEGDQLVFRSKDGNTRCAQGAERGALKNAAGVTPPKKHFPYAADSIE